MKISLKGLLPGGCLPSADDEAVIEGVDAVRRAARGPKAGRQREKQPEEVPDGNPQPEGA